MSAQQLAGRKLSAATGVSAMDGYRGNATSKQIDQMMLIQRQMQKCALRFVDRGGMTVSQIDSILRRENHRKKVRVLVIDYLQILTPSQASRGHHNRTNEVSEMTRELKQMAMRWKIPILLLSQLSRECEKREDKRPMLSDLRDSGSIEQDANNVWFLYRDEYYAGKEEPQRRTTESGEDFAQRYARWSDRLASARNKMEVIIAKHRTGPTGKIDLFCDLTTMSFGSLDKVHQQEDML
jgi:replicative DNA helicase